MINFIKLIKPKYNNDSLAIIARNIGSLHSDGIAFLNILELLMEVPLARGYKESIYDIQYDIETGKSFEDSLKKHEELFPEFFISMVSIGERSGRLNEVLKGIEEYYSKMSSIKRIITNALSYPIVLIIAIIALVIFLALFIIPNFIGVYSSMGAEIPKSSLIIYNFVNKLKESPLIIGTYVVSWAVVIPYIFIKYYLKKYVRIPFEKIFIIGEIYEYISISLLSIIVKSGINLSLGLDYCTKSFRNVLLNKKFKRINEIIMNGKTLSEALQEVEGYSKYTIAIVKLGEESGSMDERLSLLSLQLEKKVFEKIDKLLIKIQPTLIIFMAGVVLIFVMIFILPLFGSIMTGAGG